MSKTLKTRLDELENRASKVSENCGTCRQFPGVVYRPVTGARLLCHCGAALAGVPKGSHVVLGIHPSEI